MSMPLPGPIAIRAAQDCMTPEVLSVRENGGNNRGKYVQVYQKYTGNNPGDAWCASFVCYRLFSASKKLGLKLPDYWEPTAWTPNLKSWAKEHGLWIPIQSDEKVLPGDLGCFYFSNLRRIAHTGMVVKRIEQKSPSGLGTISLGVMQVEGNTSADAGVNRNGDGVYLKDRRWNEFGEEGGHVRLPF